MKKDGKNLSIELMRYLMIIAVAVLHFGEDFVGDMRIFLGGGALGVDFFFLIGGFYLAHHYYKHKSSESPVVQTNKYFIGRLRRLYPAYMISLGAILAIYWSENYFSMQWLGKHLWETKWQYVFLHFLCPNVGYDLRSMWYMSSFVFVMYIVYFLLSYNERLMMGVFPIASIIILTHIYATYGTICIQGAWEGWLYGGTLRGFAEMTLGAFIYGNVKYCKDEGVHIKKSTYRILATIVKWLAMILILFLMRIYAVDTNDFVKLFLIVLFIRLSYCNCYECNSKSVNAAISWLGSINYWIFCLHLVISHLIVKYLHYIDYRVALVIYLIGITAIASLCQCIENYIHFKRMEKSR